jgi:hypothetical protein
MRFYNRGWSYVNCIEAVATQDMMHGNDQCWKMTTNCRDIFQTAGPAVPMPSHLATAMGLSAGTLAAVMMVLAVRGDLFRLLSRIRRSAPVEMVEFSAVIDTDID